MEPPADDVRLAVAAQVECWLKQPDDEARAKPPDAVRTKTLEAGVLLLGSTSPAAEGPGGIPCIFDSPLRTAEYPLEVRDSDPCGSAIEFPSAAKSESGRG
jgi:hypothetical protein